MRCSRQVDVDMNGAALKGVDCFKYFRSQMTANGGCARDVYRMNEEYKARGALNCTKCKNMEYEKCKEKKGECS